MSMAAFAEIKALKDRVEALEKALAEIKKPEKVDPKTLTLKPK